MPNFNMKTQHNQTEEEAIRRIKDELAGLKTRFAGKIDDLEESWEGNTCKFRLSAMGFSGTGTATVSQTVIEIAGNIPFPALFVKGKIESIIRERLGKILA